MLRAMVCVALVVVQSHTVDRCVVAWVSECASAVSPVSAWLAVAAHGLSLTHSLTHSLGLLAVRQPRTLALALVSSFLPSPLPRIHRRTLTHSHSNSVSQAQTPQ